MTGVQCTVEGLRLGWPDIGTYINLPSVCSPRGLQRRQNVQCLSLAKTRSTQKVEGANGKKLIN